MPNESNDLLHGDVGAGCVSLVCPLTSDGSGRMRQKSFKWIFIHCNKLFNFAQFLSFALDMRVLCVCVDIFASAIRALMHDVQRVIPLSFRVFISYTRVSLEEKEYERGREKVDFCEQQTTTWYIPLSNREHRLANVYNTYKYIVRCRRHAELQLEIYLWDKITHLLSSYLRSLPANAFTLPTYAVLSCRSAPAIRLIFIYSLSASLLMQNVPFCYPIAHILGSGSAHTPLTLTWRTFYSLTKHHQYQFLRLCRCLGISRMNMPTHTLTRTENQWIVV